jgi:hypothetical protein
MKPTRGLEPRTPSLRATRCVLAKAHGCAKSPRETGSVCHARALWYPANAECSEGRQRSPAVSVVRPLAVAEAATGPHRRPSGVTPYSENEVESGGPPRAANAATRCPGLLCLAGVRHLNLLISADRLFDRELASQRGASRPGSRPCLRCGGRSSVQAGIDAGGGTGASGCCHVRLRSRSALHVLRGKRTPSARTQPPCV